MYQERMFEYEDKSDKYLLTAADYADFAERQFYHLYRSRFRQLSTRVLKAAETYFGKPIEPTPLSLLNKNQDSLILGVVFKHVRSGLLTGLDDEVDENDDDEPLAVIGDDEENNSLQLEDDQKQVVTLSGAIDSEQFCTGIVLGVYGFQSSDNSFLVKNVIMPDFAPYMERPMLNDDVFVAFTCGLNFKLSNYCLGEKLSRIANTLVKEYYGRLARIVFAGNHSSTFCECEKCSKISLNDVLTLGATLDADKTQLAVHVHSLVRRCFHAFDIDVMPGEQDPCSLMLPQQPLPTVLLQYLMEDSDVYFTEEVNSDDEEPPKLRNDSSSSEEEIDEEEIPVEDIEPNDKENTALEIAEEKPFVSACRLPVTNPYTFSVMGYNIHGTSGQNVDSIRKVTKNNRSTTDILKQLLEIGHIAPTAPNSLDCFPYHSDYGTGDPFVLDELPHVFFAANQKEFEAKVVDFGDDRKVCLLSIPRYCDAQGIVLVNLRTFETRFIGGTN